MALVHLEMAVNESFDDFFLADSKHKITNVKIPESSLL